MSSKKTTLKDFIENEPLLEKKKKSRKKKATRRRSGGGIANSWYTGGIGIGSGSSDGGGMGESLISEIFAGIGPSSFSATQAAGPAASKFTNNPEAGMTTYPSEDPNDLSWKEEEPEMKVNKVDQARQLFQALFNRPDANRAEIINSFMKDIGVTNSTAVSYYTRFLDEFGLNTKDVESNLGQGVNMGGDMEQPAAQSQGHEALSAAPEEPIEQDESADPNRAGIIRVVDNAHMVYKRQTETGTYQELWIYNTHDSTNDELKIRRAILAGTDIPPKKTKSADGQQSYAITTMGNAQMLKISGLPN